MTKSIAIVFACGATLATVGLQARGGIGVMRARIQCLEQKIAFTSTRDLANIFPLQNAAEIYFTNPDGTGGQRVTDNLVGDGFLKLRADGKRIVFDSNRRRTEAESALAPEKFLSRLRSRRHLVKDGRRGSRYD